ncbi:MAG: RelA/SpoT domain-containing protein [Verrucomicrobiota bacterium]|jgi:ppGpp synthetase/RelA/SpoT-type nucleotidyltranferase|nr:RelA/SpoT domain-containing protein [Verrucomicrobiota bacterium]
MTPPGYSRNQINRIGEILVAESADMQTRAAALDVLGAWRTLHWYPLHQFQMMLQRSHVAKIDPSGIVAQRLKRLPTIIDKLKNRQQHMALSRMQDIGGLRVVLGAVSKVREVERRIQAARWKHHLKNRKDYIAEPRESGYRGIHLVYEYQSARKPDFDGLLIEIQLRTRLQHLWATAVETVGVFYQEALKSSLGSAMWLDFFKLASACFALEENEQPSAEFRSLTRDALTARLREHIAAHNLLPLLKAITPLSEKLPTLPKGTAYLLIRAESGGAVSVIPFRDETAASDFYGDLEQAAGTLSGATQVVLVAVSDLRKLRQAYPNFFMNLSDFLKQLNKLLK